MDLERDVRAAFALREPAPDFEDRVMARVSARAWRASQGRPRRRRHLLLFGVLFVVAAAAATGITFRAELLPRLIAQSAASEPAPTTTGVAARRVDRQVPVPAGPVGFTVHLRSLQFDSTDPVVQGRVREYYAAIADGLRAVSGLRLLDDQAAEAAATPAGFRVTIDEPAASIAAQLLTKREWAVTFKVEVLREGVYVPAHVWTRGGAYGPESMAAQPTGGPLSGRGCPALILCAPAAIAAWQIKDLRLQLFPPDPSLQRDLEAQLLDPARSLVDRMASLQDLHDLTVKTRVPMSTEVVHEALRWLEGFSVPGDRSTVWYYLSGQRHPAMLQPLINAAVQEVDAWDRLGAVSQLADEFKEDPAARAALQTIALRDPDLLNRKVAERALSGNVSWNDYVVATVKDADQSLQQRLGPLRWMMTESSSARETGLAVDPIASLSGVLFGKERQAFVDLLVQAGMDTRASRSLASSALKIISSMQRPESTGFLLAVFEAAPDANYLSLLKDHMEDPRVRKRVEELAAESGIPSLKAAATEMLGM